MSELTAQIYDATSASLDSAPIQIGAHDDSVYAAILREAIARAAGQQQAITLTAHDLTRGRSDRMRIHPDGRVEHDTHPTAVPAAAAPSGPGSSPLLAAEPELPVILAPSLDDFLKPTKPVAHSGWRKALHTVTGGALNLGPSAAEARRSELVEAVRTRATQPEVCAVICLKGGIGKTSTTAGVGLSLARYRGDRIIALDANPDAGDLYERTCPGPAPATLTDLASSAGDVQSMTDLARFTGLAERLAIVAGDQEPTISESLSAEDFQTALQVVQHYYNVVLVDCGTGVTHPSMVAILGAARHVVIAGGYAVSGARRAERTLRWLRSAGYAHLAQNAVVVLTQTANVSSIVDTAAIESTLAELAATVITVPHDQAVADGTTISLDNLQPATAEAYLRIAASVSGSFS